MELNVLWSTFSQNEYLKALTYVHDEFGLKAAKELQTSVDLWIQRIAQNPEISAPEEFLRNEVRQYRSKIVGKYNKLVYWYDSTTVYISDFWDMRKDPAKMSKRVTKK